MTNEQFTKAEALRAIAVADAMVRLMAKNCSPAEDLRLKGASQHLNAAADLVDGTTEALK